MINRNNKGRTIANSTMTAPRWDRRSFREVTNYALGRMAALFRPSGLAVPDIPFRRNRFAGSGQLPSTKATVGIRCDELPMALMVWTPAGPAAVPEGIFPVQEKSPVGVAVAVQMVT